MDLDSNFSIFGVRRFTEWPGPLHWIAFPVEILTKPLIHWIPPPFSLKTLFFNDKSASSDPLPKNRLLSVRGGQIRNLNWAIPPVRLGLSGRNSGKIPERPRKRSQSISWWNFPREYGWDAPNPIIPGIWAFQSISRILSPPSTAGDAFFLVMSRLLPAWPENCSSVAV